LQLFKMK